MATAFESTPDKDGFVMPGEFEPQTRCWITWPHRPDNWRCKGEPAQQAFTQVIKAIARFEPVGVIVTSEQEAGARQAVGGVENVEIVVIATDDCWTRDIGPSFVVDGSGSGGVRGVDWEFNAWGGENGGCYQSWAEDDLLPTRLLGSLGLGRYRAPFILEGGSIHSDGQGTILTTEECLLHPNRNPAMTRDQIEQGLCTYTGASKVVWLPRGVYGDEDTNGHVDNIAMFVRPGEVALLWTDDTADPQYEHSRLALDVLASQTDAQGRSFVVHKVHQPSPLYRTEEEATTVDSGDGMSRQPGERLAASYVNCLLVNGAVILPAFNDPVYDQKAVEKMKEIFPDREIVPVYSREILLGGGNIHCITQHQPAPRK